MSLQDPHALALDALSILKDLPPNPKQPLVEDGVHLRWFPGNDRGFPLKGGYYLFRRRVGGTPAPTCLMPLLKDSNPVDIASKSVLVTAIGTLVGYNGVRLQPVPIAPGKPGVLGFRLDREGIQFRLPAGVTASEFTVRLRFPIGTASRVSTGPLQWLSRLVARIVATFFPEGQVVASLGSAVVFSQNIIRPAPPNQDSTTNVHPTRAVDTIRIWAQSAVLLDLCYIPVSTGGGVPPVPASPPISAAAPLSTRKLPGRGWDIIPTLTSVIKLPLFHPQFPASPGSESLNASMAIAKSRLHYGAWTDSFNAATPTPGTGTIMLTNGSPLVTGSGTNWTAELVGKLIYLPSGSGGIDPTERVILRGSDHTAYAVMAVLAPDCVVLSRSYSGPSHSNAPYQLLVDDDFAELHDRVASLLQSPNDMRAAIVPPPLDQGTVAGGKCLMVFAGGLASQVNGIGTQWTTSLAGCWIEIGPSWSQSTYLAGSNIYRIQAVSSTSQLTLDRPFSGLPHFAPSAKCDYRIFARAAGDDPNSASFDFKPMDLLELASLMPSYAQALGLYWIDKDVKGKDVFDYIVIADHENRFSQQVGKALDWLNGTPDFTGDSVDGFVKLGVKHVGSPPLAAPSQLELFRLPTGGARASIAHPDRADSDAGVSVQNAASWANPSAPQPTPVMLNLSRLFRGTDSANLAAVGNDATGYDDLGRLLPSRRDPAQAPNPPAGWPTDPIHFVDSGPDHTGLDVGWYSYRAYAIDLYGRFSPDSQPIPWRDIDKSSAPGADAIHLADTTPPPPPAGVLAWILDDNDPYLRRDQAYESWKAAFNSLPPPIGLRIQWRWPWSHQNQGPDLKEFRVYALENPINARTGRVTSVTPVSGQPSESLVTFDLAVQENTPVDAYLGASLQAGNRAFTILASQTTMANQTTTVQLTVRNGGPQQITPPDSNVDGAIVISIGHPLHKELLNPGNWEKWLAAVPQDLAGTRYEVEMVEDPSVVNGDTDATDPAIATFDAKANTFIGAQATWNGSAFVLDVIPSPHDLAAVRPGIDVLALSWDNPPGYFVFDIGSVQASSFEIVPVQVPDPTLPATTNYQWRIGRANSGLQGLAGIWDAATRTFSLDGSPDLSNVSLGADLVYIGAPGATPANLDFFFAIEALDEVSHSLTLKDTANLSAWPNGSSLPWKIGRPVRYYEVFLPNPAVPEVGVGPDLASPLLEPTLGEPVRHGTIGVSSADYRNEVPDQYWPARHLTGNESYLSGPGPVFRVMRDPPPSPTYTWNVTRLLASKANYHDDSYFTVRWNKPATGPYSAHVMRAMDNSLFLAHWKLNGSLPTAGAPPGISVLSTFDAHKANSEYSDAVTLYDQLDDTTLWWLAGRDELADAYMQVTINPLDLADPANADRLGPDNDPATFTADSTACAYIDKLPGKSTNRYFYRVMLLDGAQNRGAMGAPTPPVYLPKVVPPKKPVVAKVVGEDRAITVQWVPCRDPSVTEYRIYRTADRSLADDVRSMQLVATVPLLSTNPAAVTQWKDLTPPLQTNVHYRIVAVDTDANPSLPSSPTSARAFNDSFPVPPVWNTPVLQADGTTLLLSWQAVPDVSYRVERRASSSLLWNPISGWLRAEVDSFVDANRTTQESYEYRINAEDARGIYSKSFLTLTV